jgi:hypothetical protein
MVESITAVLNEQGVAYVHDTSLGWKDTYPVASSRTEESIQTTSFTRTGKVVPRGTIHDYLGLVEAKARRSGIFIPTYMRVGKNQDGHLLLDLARGGFVATIYPGGFQVAVNQTDAFFRPDGMGDLPIPIAPESVSKALELLRAWLGDLGIPVNVHDLIIAVLVEYLRCDTPHPILEFVGAAGSGKTTIALLIANLIDPLKSGYRPDIPLTDSDLAAAAQQNYCLGADNLGRLDAKQQNLICRVSTGSVVEVRRYYTQNETIKLPIHRPLIITSIAGSVTAPDAMSRTIRVLLPRLQQRRSILELKAEFAERHAELLGALLHLAGAALQSLQEL